MSSQVHQDTLNVPSRAGTNSPNILIQDVDADEQAVSHDIQAVGSPSGSEDPRLSPSGTKKSDNGRSGDGIPEYVLVYQNDTFSSDSF